MNQIIPLTNDPNQSLAVTLTVNGAALTLNLTMRYSEIAQYWIMGISDVDGNMLLANIPLLTGAWPSANVLGQYQYLNIGSAYVLNASNIDSPDSPTSANLGSDFVLLWGDNV